MPFGFWSVWDPVLGAVDRVGRDASSLPFGFWSVWDERPLAWGRGSRRRLHCLSAFGLFGTLGVHLGHPRTAKVFIAFRLLVCLGLAGGVRVPTKAEECLHCLSAFGLFGTPARPAAARSRGTGLHCLSAFGLFGTNFQTAHRLAAGCVFIAFRLLVCLGLL